MQASWRCVSRSAAATSDVLLRLSSLVRTPSTSSLASRARGFLCSSTSSSASSSRDLAPTRLARRPPWRGCLRHVASVWAKRLDSLDCCESAFAVVSRSSTMTAFIPHGCGFQALRRLWLALAGAATMAAANTHTRQHARLNALDSPGSRVSRLASAGIAAARVNAARIFLVGLQRLRRRRAHGDVPGVLTG